MKQKNLIAIAVAGACACPLFAMAAGATHEPIVGHWEVKTPSSVDESAPYLTGRASHLGGWTAQTPTFVAAAPAEVITPSSVDDSSGPSWTVEDRRTRGTRARTASLPNPQTPWSPNESGSDRYAEDMQYHADQVAAVEQARIAAAASYTETMASTEATREVDRLLGASDQPEQPGERETVAVAPVIVDSRMPGLSREIAVQGDTPLPPDNMPMQTGEVTAGVTVDTGSAEAEMQRGATVQ